MWRYFFLCLGLLILLPATAEARPRARSWASAPIMCDQSGCSDWGPGRRHVGREGWSLTPERNRLSRRAVPRSRFNVSAMNALASIPDQTRYIPHPSGCPSRAFCGCGAAVRVFGRPVRELWASSSWFRFPRTSPASGMVGVRRGHVFVLEQHLGGDMWMVTDYNSGGRKSRIHARSIRGFAIVNPRAGLA